jgi:hypothetical protein
MYERMCDDDQNKRYIWVPPISLHNLIWIAKYSLLSYFSGSTNKSRKHVFSTGVEKRHERRQDKAKSNEKAEFMSDK